MRPDQISMAGITGYGWQAVLDALLLSINGISGIQEQPRCSTEDDRGYNAAGRYLEEMQAILCLEIDRLRRELRNQPVASAEEWQNRCHILLQCTARDGEFSPLEMADFALSLHKEGVSKLDAKAGGATC